MHFQFQKREESVICDSNLFRLLERNGVVSRGINSANGMRQEQSPSQSCLPQSPHTAAKAADALGVFGTERSSWRAKLS
jgi:hypothetical protein